MYLRIGRLHRLALDARGWRAGGGHLLSIVAPQSALYSPSQPRIFLLMKTAEPLRYRNQTATKAARGSKRALISEPRAIHP